MEIDHSLFICSPVELKCRDPRPHDSKTRDNPPMKFVHSPSDWSSGRACSSVLLLNENVEISIHRISQLSQENPIIDHSLFIGSSIDLGLHDLRNDHIFHDFPHIICHNFVSFRGWMNAIRK